jgi:hypothetical protein
MTVFNLGVIDIPYAYEQQRLSKKGKPLKRGRTVTKSTTTGEVAEYLEDQYHVMETFFEVHGEEVMEALLDSYEGAIDNVLAGGALQQEPAREAFEKIEQRFRDFLTNEEMNALGMPGVPTEASGQGTRVGGIQHRFAHPYARGNVSRPSFIDTGLYQSSFRIWQAEF